MLTPYNTDIRMALKWQQNKAPNITLLINQKANWYDQFQTQFWTNWTTNVFEIRTANPFGLLIWCIILGVPSQLFGLSSNARAWAYGKFRQNFVARPGTVPFPPDNPNIIGGNFAGGGQTTILNLDEARWILRLRYVALVSNGRLAFVNYMLNFIFNDGEPWDFAGGRYFYVADSTVAPVAVGGKPVATITGAFNIEYRIGHNMGFSDQFLNVLRDESLGVAPQFAGSKYTVNVEA